MRIALQIEYEGTAYGGWQVQPNADSIQARLEAALFALTGEAPRVHGSGRTDAGVHAMCQTAHFDINDNCNITPERFARALNAKLPADIRVRESWRAADDFHARFSAVGKKYLYVICNMPQKSALYRNMSTHVHQPLDVNAMAAGAQYLIGKHDFTSFASVHMDAHDAVREIFDIFVAREGGFVRIEVDGNGFLRNMVRIIAGTLMDVGMGKIQPEDVGTILEGKDRSLAGATAPACGLFLVEAIYN